MLDRTRRIFSARALLVAMLGAVASLWRVWHVCACSRGLAQGLRHHRDGLLPSYPDGCSPLTSLYASWTDVDGSQRDEAHSGVDGGRLGEPIFAPGPGEVRAVWVADWGWGKEGALLVRHSAKELNLDEGAEYYYSAFDHINYDEIEAFPGRPAHRARPDHRPRASPRRQAVLSARGALGGVGGGRRRSHQVAREFARAAQLEQPHGQARRSALYAVARARHPRRAHGAASCRSAAARTTAPIAASPTFCPAPEKNRAAREPPCSC